MAEGGEMKKIHNYLCLALDSDNEKDCTCELPKYKMSEEEAKAIVIRQIIKNIDSNQFNASPITKKPNDA